MAKVIGITGGIGSGKTTVCKVFQQLEIPVFEADIVAKQLMNEDDRLKKALSNVAGECIYNSKGQLNREILAAVLFNNDEVRESVNNLVHPAVHKAFFQWLEKNKKAAYVVYEAAILFEGGFHKQTDYSILVAAPEIQRIERVKKRSNMTEQMVRERMKSQWPEEQKRALADLCLENDNRHLILPEIIRIDNKMKNNGTIC